RSPRAIRPGRGVSARAAGTRGPSSGCTGATRGRGPGPRTLRCPRSRRPSHISTLIKRSALKFGMIASNMGSITHALRIEPVTGLAEGVRQVLSPHADARPQSTAPELIVVHGISLPPGEFGGPWIERLFSG